MDSELPALFSVIDTVLSLHYTSSISTPKINELCHRATQLANKRIDSSTFGRILAYDPNLYKIVSYGSGSYDFGVSIPQDMSVAQFSSSLPLRRQKFEELVKLKADKAIAPLNLLSVAVVEALSLSPRKLSSSPTKASPLKITKNISKTMKNDRSRFLFKEKLAAVESSKANGLSLIERIRLKEKMNKESLGSDTPEKRYENLIHSKMPAVYDVLYELFNKNLPRDQLLNFRSFPLSKIVSIVCDSFVFNIAESEVRDTIKALERVLAPNIQTIDRDGVQGIKIFHLDREKDLKLLKPSAS